MVGVRTAEADLSVHAREGRWRGYLAKVACGDALSLARLYDQGAPIMLAVALRIMKNKADAEEVILDVFQQVWRTAHKFDPSRGNVWSWLTLLVRSRAVDRLRTVAFKRHRDHISIAEVWKLASLDPTPDRTALIREEHILITSALRRLPSEQRHAVELAYFSGLTHVQIASELGVPLGTIKTRIRSAIDKLRVFVSQGGLATAEPAR